MTSLGPGAGHAGGPSHMTDMTHRLLEEAAEAPPVTHSAEVRNVRVASAGQLAALGSGARTTLVREGVPAKLADADPSLWGAEAEPEATVRLGWLQAPSVSRALLPEIARLRERTQAAGLDHVVLAGMGGSSLAPEVITRTAGAALTVLDTTDPHQVAATLADRIERTVVVVSSKSGGTIETDSHRRVYEQAFRDAGVDDIASRIIVVTDPGSPFEAAAREAGYSVVLADPNVGGRYSALTAFGLVPSALAGVGIERLLDDAEALLPSLRQDEDNPGLELGAVLGGGASAGRDKVLLADAGSGIVGFGDWAEQLLAESTGKESKGLLPVVVEGTDSPDFAGASPTAHRVLLGAETADPDATAVSGPLGAQFLLWEYATAIVGRILGINPFDQPNVQEAKDATAALLEAAGEGPLPEGEPYFTDGAVAVYGDRRTLNGARTLPEALHRLLSLVDARGYLAVMAYLDRAQQADAAGLRTSLASALQTMADGAPVTFGWGPRFLHSTGQYHKGGPQDGVFLSITGAFTQDVQVPGRPFTMGRLQLAQALGDLQALGKRGRHVVRLHLLDRRAGLQQLVAAAAELQP